MHIIKRISTFFLANSTLPLQALPAIVIVGVFVTMNAPVYLKESRIRLCLFLSLILA